MGGNLFVGVIVGLIFSRKSSCFDAQGIGAGGWLPRPIVRVQVHRRIGLEEFEGVRLFDADGVFHGCLHDDSCVVGLGG